MEDKKKITANYIYNLIYQILTIILPIITTPYLSRVLGSEGIGIYGYTISIVTYFTLIGALGISKYGQREIAYVQNDITKRSKIFWELNIIKMCTIVISTITFFMLFCIKGEYVDYYRILLLELLAVFFDITWFYQGIEEFKKIVIRNTIVKIISIILIFILIKDANDLIKYVYIYVLSNFLGNGILWLNIKKYVVKIKINFIDVKKHIRPMVSLFIPQIATSVYTVLDKTMLGILESNISEVGYYEQSQKIIKIALTFVTTMSIVMLPRISNTYANGDKEKVKRYMKKSFQFNWFLSIPIILGIMAISKQFVPWFYGEGYTKIIKLLICTSPIILPIAFSTTIGSQYLVSIKKQNIQTVAVIIGAIANVVFNLILIPKLKSEGAVIATVIAEFLITLIEVLYVIKNGEIKIKDMFDQAYKYIIAGIIMFVSVYIISLKMPVGIVYTMSQIIVGIIVYTLVLIALKDEFLDNVLINFRKRIKNAKH